jgi:hypothetical protein
MLDPRPVSRASVEDILSHPWLQQQPEPAHCGRQRRVRLHTFIIHTQITVVAVAVLIKPKRQAKGVYTVHGYALRQ